ncbi:IS256 family transposase [Pelomicrobium methylotrophicum]|uniref:Mutator family transposase n=1 Tax=Pelomicrobium methylotrophicum TaxID=2602750 RepID=A0A5C7ER38_9PROT|nr:IS256 family transposase [Pelomicrobium methylotrophicum]TXF10006.1 IS256 family transposase [Pelomicrobium methylotrophicum]
MNKDTSKTSGSANEMGFSLEELIRRGARELIQKAIEVEVQELLAEYGNVKMLGGRRAVVRNGYLPERQVLTAVGPVKVRVPKVRDRSGTGVKFNSRLVPPFVRRSQRMSAALPWLYLKGISTGDMREALTVLVGDQARGLSPNVVARLKGEWAAEYGAWMKRDLSASRYVYWWADGIHTGLRQESDARQCLLVIIGVRPDGSKELVTIGDGLRESRASWLDVLRDLKTRGLEAGPRLAVGDGALGFWAALDEVYPETRHQRCWVHKTANVLNALPKSLQAKAKADLHEIWMAPTREQAVVAFNHFIKAYGAKYPRVVEKLTRDREALLAFYDFPAEHWIHLRTTNPIESTFATVRHRTTRTKNCVSRATFLGLAFKLVQEAEKSWRRIRGVDRLTDLMNGMLFKDGVPVPNSPPDEQRLAA